MNRPLPDNGMPVKKGDLSFIYQGVYHPIVWYGEEPYRPRVETLVIKDGRYVYLNMYDVEKAVTNERLGSYEVPGGSIDNDCDKITQAENEVNEEILVKVKNIYHTGVQYYEPFSDGNVELFKKESPLSYRGFTTEVFIAEYAGKFDVKKVEDKDLDPEMQKGKFYAITLVADKLTEPHINALLNCPYIDTNVKLVLQLQVRNKDVTIESVTESISSEVVDTVVESSPINDMEYIYVISMRYRSLFANAVRTFTKSDYNHSAISLDHSLSHMYTYTREKTSTPHSTPHGFSIESIDFMLKNRDPETYVKVVAFPVSKDKLEALRLKFDNLTKFNSSSYDFSNVIKIIFGIKTKPNDEDSYVCSTFVASCLKYIGVKLPKDASLMTPEDISNLNSNGVTYEGLLKSYNSNKHGITESIKRSDLPDDEFGIPEERKYPLDTEEHVRSAIKLFNHVDSKYEADLAKRILKKKEEYGIDDITIGEKNRLSKYISLSESIVPILEAPGDDDPDEATDYTADVDGDSEPDTATDYTADAGDGVDTDEPDDATDYTTDVYDDTSSDDVGDDSIDSSMDDDVTDYTDDLGDDDAPTNDTDTSSDDTDTSEDDAENDTTDKNSIVKNYNLILDFQSLYRYLEQISTGLESTVFKSPIQNSALTQIVNNMRRLKNAVANYVEFNFGNDYVTNLYNYNIFVKALKINLEMLSITKDLHTDESTNT